MHFTKAVIIGKQDKGENDKLITVYTKNYGKVNILARGIGKTSSKLASQLDLFNLIEVGFAQGKAFKVLTSAMAEDDFRGIKENLDKFRSALHFSNLINKFILFEEEDESVFDILREAFLFLDKRDFSELQMKFFLRYCELRLLSYLGYRPPNNELPEAFINKKGKIKKKDLDDLEDLFLNYFKNIV